MNAVVLLSCPAETANTVAKQLSEFLEAICDIDT